MIGVIDYRAGNAPSVGYALTHLGLEHRLVTTPGDLAAGDLAAVDRIVLPGVGAAQATMDSLTDAGFLDPLQQLVLGDQVPFLGICIGLQVLFEHSAEGAVDCLGWVPGAVHRFSEEQRVPQIGWNAVQFRHDHPVTAGLPDGGHYYFVNSYYAAPTEPDDVLGITEYGTEFCSVIARDNIVATQFHAEKSGWLGLQLLTNFAAWDGS